MNRPLLALLFLLLPLTAAAADSNDTYNFYFQKAPGPVTVNQGTASKTVEPNAPSKAEVEALRATAASVVAKNEPAASDRHDLEVRLGYFDGLGQDRDDLFASQYNLGIQLNFSRVIGLAVDGFYLRKPTMHWQYDTQHPNTGVGSYFDYAAALAISPLHFSLNPKVSVAVSLLTGYQTTPTVSADMPEFIDWSHPTVKIDHHGSIFAGARVGFDLSSRVRLEANYRKIFDLNHSLAGVTLACLL